MFRSFVAIIAILLITLLPLAAHGGVDSAKVDDAINKAVEWLYAQEKDGNWERSLQGLGEHGEQATGYTALVTYALLSAGQSHQDPRIQQAVDFLLGHETTGIYALGLRCQVWLLLPQTPEVKTAMRKDGPEKGDIHLFRWPAITR
jgi:hypothetical protein